VQSANNRINESHTPLNVSFIIIIINEYPEAGPTASIFAIMNTNYNINFTNTIITL